MKKSVTELVFILDRSGSMSGLEADTVGGFNSMISNQKKLGGDCFVTTILFNNNIDFLHDRVSLENVPEMTEDDFAVRGTTALIDAIGYAIRHIEHIHKYAKAEDVPDKTMFVIMTDGYENSSHIYSAELVRQTIADKKEKHGWEFLFIGANIDAVSTAANFGIDKDRAANYCADSVGTAAVYQTVGQTVAGFRKNKSIQSNWSESIDSDYNKRKK